MSFIFIVFVCVYIYIYVLSAPSLFASAIEASISCAVSKDTGDYASLQIQMSQLITLNIKPDPRRLGPL